MRYSILLTFLVLSSTLFGQNEVRVQVTSLSNNEAIPFAKVMIREKKLFAITDMEGTAVLENVDNDDYLLEVVVTGFEPYSKSISVSSDMSISVELSSESQDIGEIVISGTMKEVSKTNSTVNVEVYSPKFFKKNPTPSVYDALQNVNGVRPQLNCNICNTGDIHINGLEGPYTMMLIDGMPIVSSLSTVYGLSGIPNSLIERIEVVKGPASTLYGSEAMGGVINIITKRPNNAPTLSADVFTTTWLETNADLGFRFGIGKREKEKSPLSTYIPTRPVWDVLTGINYYNYNTPIDNNNDGFTDVTLQNRISVFQKWKFNPKKDHRMVSIAGRYLYEDRWGGEMDWTSNFRGGDSLYGESIYTSRWELLGMYQLPVKERVFLTGSFNLHQQNSYYGDVFYRGDQITGFAQAYWDKHLKNHDFIVGTAVRYVNYDDNTPATAANDSLNPQNLRDIQWIPGVYAQDEIKFGKRHKALLGSRLDYHSDHGIIFTPRLGYKWMSENLHIIRLNAGTGFRVVNIFTEDHAALTGARELVIEDNISPEESYNVNLNYSKTFITKKNKMIVVDASAFYTYFTNRIIADYDADPNEIRYANLDGHAVSQGVSANLTFKLLPGLSIRTGATLMEIYSVDNGVRVDQILTENFTATWAASYEVPRTAFTIDYTGNVYSPMRLPLLNELDPRPEYSPWWSIQNVQLTYNGFDNWEIYGGVKNLLNWTPERGTPFQIARPNDPFDSQVTFDANGDAVPTANNPYGLTFDPSYVYGPNQGIRGFLGVRYTFN